MGDHISQFCARWECSSSRPPNYSTSGAGLPVPVHTLPSSALVSSNAPTYSVNGIDFTMLTPSPPLIPDHEVEEANSSPRERAVIPDEGPIFTNLDKLVLQPDESHGADFMIKPSTQQTRLRARAEIFGEGPSSLRGHPSDILGSPQARHWSGSLAALQSWTELLTARVKRVLKKVQDSVGKKVQKVRVADQVALQRIEPVRRRAVKRTKPITKLLRDAAKATRINAPVLTRRITRMDTPWRQSPIRRSGNASRMSLLHFVEANLEVGIDAVGRDDSNNTTASSGPVDQREAMAELPLTPSNGASNESASEPVNNVVHNCLDEHERVRMIDHFDRRSSIRGRKARFNCNILKFMDIMNRCELAQRTATVGSDLIAETQDTMQMSQIPVDAAPNLRDLHCTNLLSILRDEEAMKLCELIDHGVYCRAYWRLATELSVDAGEAIDGERSGHLAANIHHTRRANIEDILQQLINSGADHVNAPRMEFFKTKTEGLNVSMPSCRRLDYRAPSTFHNNEVFELDATETETMRAAPTDETSVSSDPNTASGLMTSRGERRQYQLDVGKLLLDHWCKNVVAGEESDSKKRSPPSSGILDDLNAALAEALDGYAIVESDRVEDGTFARAFLAASETGQSAQTRRNGIWPRHSQHRKDHAQYESAPSKVTRENGWISADTVANFGPEDLDIEALLPKEHGQENSLPGPSHLSERAKGKLPMARSQSTRTFPGQIVAPPYRGLAASQTLPQGMAFSRQVPKAPVPPSRVKVRQGRPQTSVRKQGVSQAEMTSQTEARSPLAPDTMRSLSMSAKENPTPRTSLTLPRSFTMRTKNTPKLPRPAQISKSDRLQIARRLLNASAKPVRSPGAARVQSTGAEPSSLTSRAFRVPPGPVGESAMVVNSSVGSSRPITGDTEVEAETPRDPPRLAVPTTITTTPVPQRSWLPVPHKKAIMPGTYPASDAGADE